MYTSQDKIYCYPQSIVLKNKLHIQDASDLLALERDLTTLRLNELLQKPISGEFDLNHLQNIHKYIFQDLYTWAGELRVIRISKGSITFAYPEYIKSECDKYFKQLKKGKSVQVIDKSAPVCVHSTM